MASFDVAARTLIHLGAELITSDEIALYELIKNAFDARSKRVKIRIVAPIPHRAIKEILSSINKCSDESVRTKKQYVLLLAKARKATLTALSENINDNLSPEITDYIDYRIKSVESSESFEDLCNLIDDINFISVEDSGLGMSKDQLEKVFLRIGTDYRIEHDTTSNKSPVLGNKGIGRLSMMRLGHTAEVVTWCKDQTSAQQIVFDWNQFQDPKILLSDVNFPINKAPRPESESGTIIRIGKLTSDWSQIKIESGIVNKFLRRLQSPFREKSAKSFPIDLSFNGNRRIPITPLDPKLSELADRVLKLQFRPNNAEEPSDAVLKSSIEIPGKPDSLVPQQRTVRDVCGKLNTTLEELKKIGPFTLTIQWYNRAKLAQKGLGKDLTVMRKELDVWNGGIAIYRDNFRVGLTGSDKDGDWLDIDSNALRGRGFTVNRIQTIGALEITKEYNPTLMDRSNREGLIEVSEKETLKGILMHFGLEHLRTEIQVEYKLESEEREAALIEEGTGTIQERLKLATKNICAIKKQADPELVKEVHALDKNIQFISNHVSKFNKAISELQEKREDILELAGVGTVMHSVMHELTRTTNQTRDLLGKVAKNADGNTKALLNKLESEIKSINTRLRQLDPLSPNGRQRKAIFDVVKLTKTILTGYQSRFERHSIAFELTVDGKSELQAVDVKMVRGFYSLAIESLLTNSVYWLKEGPICTGYDYAFININIDSISYTVEISDNGPGISPSDNHRIFNPGFSLRHKGNGFGLYIAKEVANHHGADIYLDTNQSVDERLRTFIMELPKDMG